MSTSLSARMEQMGYVDSWCCLHPTTKAFSYFSTVHLAYSCIDFFLIEKVLPPSVKSTDYSAIVNSDHGPPTLDLNLPSSSRMHQGRWKLNTALLASAEFCDHISTNIDFFLETNRSDLVSSSLLWEAFKSLYTWKYNLFQRAPG